MVGNGVCDAEFDGNAIVPFAYGQSLISSALNDKLQRHCSGSYWDAQEGWAPALTFAADIDSPG